MMNPALQTVTGMVLLRALIGILFISLLWSPVFAEDKSPLASGLDKLIDSSYREKEEIIQELGKIRDARVVPILKAMLDSKLYYRDEGRVLVFIEAVDDRYRIRDVLTGKELGVVESNAVSKIRVNNKLRRKLRSLIARLSLSNEDISIRREAIKDFIKNMNAEKAELLRELQKTEADKKVLGVMRTGIAMMDVDNEDKKTRLDAIRTLGESLLPKARGKLQTLLAKDAEGNYVEKDQDIRRAANASIQEIDSTKKWYGFLETTFFGLSLGSVLLLVAIGLAITFGVMGVINMAHGELMMLGAYTTYVVQLMMPNHLDYSLFVAIPAAFVVAGLFGIAIERGVIRFLYGRPLETLLATFGISLVLQQLVRSIFSPLNRSVSTPSWMSGSWQINDAFSLTYNRLYIIVFSLIVFFALVLLLKKTVLGLQVRAVSQNRSMAKAMGVRSEWVDALTFGLGSGIAGVAGVALSQLTNVGPNLGQSYIIDSFMVVVFGGVGNLWGTLVGALSLGVVNKYLEPWAGAVLAKILVLVFIILFIQKKPRGLFPQKGRSVEN